MNVDRHAEQPPEGWKARIESSAVSMWMITDFIDGREWRQYLVTTYHLRGADHLPEPILAFPGATHEMVIIRLDQTDRTAPYRWAHDGMFRYSDTTLAIQFEAYSDAAAEDITNALVQGAVRQMLEPDPRKNPIELAKWRDATHVSTNRISEEHRHRQAAN